MFEGYSVDLLPAEQFFAAPRLKSTEAVRQTQNEIFNASVNYSAFSLQFCLIWSEEDQDLDDSANVHVCVSVGNLIYFHIFSVQYFPRGSS